MYRKLLSQPWLIAALFLCCQLPQTMWAQKRANITLEDIWQRGTFAVKNVPGFNALKDGRRYTQLDENGGEEINSYDLSSGKKLATIFRSSTTKGLSAINDYQFSANEDKLLIYTEPEPIYRRSVLYKVWVADLKTKTAHAISDQKVLHATFSPDGSKIAYVKDNNLYIYDIADKQVTAITKDGAKNQIINGNCDWVYEEEFEFSRAYQWSPDGKYLAYYRFDERDVKEFTIPFYEVAQNYPRLYTYKYPKAGEDNSLVSIHIYNLQQQNTVAADLGSETDQYIPRIKWSRNPNQLCIFRMNRLQNKLDLLLTEANTGKSDVIYTEENKYYIEINDNISFLPDGKSLLLTSEKDGYNHIYRWNWVNKESIQLSRGAWDVATIQGVDDKEKCVYYTAGVNSPLERKLYKVNWDGSANVCLTPADGSHDITACEGYEYFLDKHSRLNSVPVYTLIDKKGKAVRVLEDNQDLKETMERYNLSVLTTLQIPGANGTPLNAWMIKPVNFDPHKKYPVLMYQYSGPGSQEVADKFPVGNYFWHQMLAQKGYIIVCADGTGTGGRGEQFKKKTYLQLGKYESDDQIAVAKWLARQAYVDEDRIGIWGWSFGGFMSATCLMKGADVFKTAIAVAPVTNWRYYDNIYTERYMRRPAENAKGYDENAPEKMASKLKGNFLMIHGTADDNVHFQNAVSLTNELIKANKQFQSEYYPNKNHGIGGGVTRLQLYRRMTEYLLNNL
jgi:dipeptidyl-peptidase-4